MKRGAAVSVVLCAACAVYGSSLLAPAPGDAGTDAAVSGDARSCGLVRWPPRPSADDPSSGDVEVLTAISSLNFMPRDGGARGYDLDGLCTCEGTPPEPESCAHSSATAHCDGEGGIDNSGGGLLDRLQQIGNILADSDLTKTIQGGSGTALLRIQGWNGKPNDTKLVFSIFTSNGTELDDAGNRIKPGFDGGDEWSVDTESLVGGVAPPYVATYSDSSAYVAGGVLVANVDFPFIVGTRSASRTFIRLKGAVVTGRLVPFGATFALEDGVLSGRWPTVNFLTTLQAFKDPFVSGGYLCGDSGTYQTLKTQICRAADISSDILSDRKGAPCDAISIAFFFDAKPAKFGPADQAMPSPPPCGVAYMDDCR